MGATGSSVGPAFIAPTRGPSALLCPYQTGWRSRGVGAEKLDQVFGDNFFFAGLEHEGVHAESVGAAFEHDGGLAAAELFRSILGIELNVTGVPLDVHVRDVIGDVWNRIRCGDTGDAGHLG